CRSAARPILDDADARTRIEAKPPDAAEMGGYDLPRRRAARLAEARPARGLVAARGLERAIADANVTDPAADRLRRVDRVRHAADPYHVPALAIVGIGVEEVVGDIIHHAVNLGAGHLSRPRVGVGQRRVAVDVFERDRLAGQDADAPAEPR